MSQLPSRTEQVSSPPAPHLRVVAQETFAKRGQALMSAAASAAGTIAARTLGIGALGIFLGMVAFIVEKSTGLLDHAWGPWGALVYLLLPLYMAAGAVGLGGVGLCRGIGRAAMDLVQKNELSQHVVDRVLERAQRLVSNAATPEVLHKPLPVAKLRELIRRASGEASEGDELDPKLGGLSRAIVRRVRRGVVGIVEARLNLILGEQEKDASAVELTLGRLGELACDHLEEKVLETLEGLRNKQAIPWAALFIAAVVLPPVVLSRLH
jgi:hypothetical protein